MSIFSQEDYYGKIEYKRYFNIRDQERLEKYTTQMNYRINEGQGNSIYLIGINDNGSIYGLTEEEIEKNIDILLKITKLLDLNVSIIIKCRYKNKNFFICKLKSNNFDESLIL